MSKSDFAAVANSRLVQIGIVLGLVSSGLGYLASSQGLALYKTASFVVAGIGLVAAGLGFMQHPANFKSFLFWFGVLLVGVVLFKTAFWAFS